MKHRMENFWYHYKGMVVVCSVVLACVLSFAHERMTQKQNYLYLALVNVSAGDMLSEALTTGFLETEHVDAGAQQVAFLNGLRLVGQEAVEGQAGTDRQAGMEGQASMEEWEYAEASQMKLLAALETKRLDVVLMDREARDAFLQGGYLEGGAAVDVSDAPALRRAGMSGKVYLGIPKSSPRKERAQVYAQRLLSGEI